MNAMQKEKDPNVTAARDEIAAILKRRDLLGLIIVASGKTERLDYLAHLEASWSCAYREDTIHGPAVRVRCKKADYPSPAQAKEALTLTVGAIIGMLDICNDLKENLSGLIAAIGQKVEIYHRTQKLDD